MDSNNGADSLVELSHIGSQVYMLESKMVHDVPLVLIRTSLGPAAFLTGKRTG